MVELNVDEQDFVDSLIWEDMRLAAVQFYWKVMGYRLNQAVEAFYIRQRQLGVDFDGDSLARKNAFERLNAIKDPVAVIEGSWDGDDSGWFIVLSAIVQAPSEQHPRYTSCTLCSVRGFKDQVERAVVLGRELAEAAGTHIHLTSVAVDDTIRWWDTQPA